MKDEKKSKIIEAEVVEEPNDIFEKAAMQTISQKRSILLTEETITDTNLTLPTNKKIRKTWKELKVAIDHEHAKRFNDILNNLPDREFARVYLKSLEFFKPKIIRQGGEKPLETDTLIEVKINKNKDE